MGEQTLFDKGRNLVLSNLHSILDKAIDQNKVESVKQYLRDLGDARDQIADALAVSTGRCANIAREVGQTRASVQSIDESINVILGDGDTSNDAHAAPLEARMMQQEENLTLLNEELKAEEATKTELAQALAKVEARYQTMAGEIRRLDMMERTSKAQNRAADALTAAADTAGDGPNIDSVSNRIREESAVAKARFDRAIGNISDVTDDAVADAKVAARLAARRERAQAPAAPAS